MSFFKSKIEDFMERVKMTCIVYTIYISLALSLSRSHSTLFGYSLSLSFQLHKIISNFRIDIPLGPVALAPCPRAHAPRCTCRAAPQQCDVTSAARAALALLSPRNIDFSSSARSMYLQQRNNSL